MILKKILSFDKKERVVTQDIKTHIQLLCSACETFRSALESEDRNLMRSVIDLEREGDSIRRTIISHIYEGAFLPYLRPDLCKFVAIVDEVFDLLKNAASYYAGAQLPEKLKSECVRVSRLNQNMCEMLLLSYEAMLTGKDLREKALAIRIYEKKIDDIKFDLFEEAKTIEIDTFWAGRMLADLISTLTSISDVIEDASDHLQIINVGLR